MGIRPNLGEIKTLEKDTETVIRLDTGSIGLGKEWSDQGKERRE